MDSATQFEDDDHGFRGGWLAALLVAMAVFLGIAPTLSWLEFASGSENLNAATVLEMHRDGNWLVPTLNRQPRLAKPPLTAWTSAALIPQAALANIDSPDQSVRDAAYDRFAFYLRWPSLVLACGMILSVYLLGRSMESPRFGWSAAIVCASSILFLRFARSATTDIQLACWVALANAAFASLIFTAMRWWKLVLLGLALGLSMLAKGPVALVQTVVPWLLFALLDQATRSRVLSHRGSTILRSLLVAAIAIGIAVPWFAYIMLRNTNAMSVWWREVTREGATNLEPDVWFSYASVFLLIMPWTAFFIAGLGTALGSRKASVSRFALCLLVVPIVLMSLAKDKNDRYLLPLLPAMSILVAFALRQQFRSFDAQNSGDALLRRIQWGILIVVGLGVPALGASGLAKTIDGTSWFTLPVAAGLLLLFAAVFAASMIWSARRPGVVIPATLAFMLMAHAALVWGYRDSVGGRSELKPIADVIRVQAPDAPYWFFDPPPRSKLAPADLSIYLNRAVTTARTEERLQQAEIGAVVAMLQRKNEPPPTVPCWTPIDKRGADGRYWWALRHERATPATRP